MILKRHERPRVSGRRSVLCSLALTAGALAAGCTPRREVITYAGATTLLPVISQLAAEYERLHPGVSVAITGGGSTKGIEDVARGSADMGGVVRELTADELARVDPVPVATDGIAVIVHRDVALGQVTLEQLRGLYAGGAVQPVTAGRLVRVGKASSQGTYAAFAAGLGVPESSLQADAIGSSNGEVVALVAAQRDAIGYVSYADASEAVRSGAPIRMLQVEGVSPSLDVIASGRYPLTHRVYVVLPKKGMRGATLRFMTLLRSQQGAAMLRKAGLPPYVAGSEATARGAS